MQDSIAQARAVGEAIVRDGPTLETSQSFDNAVTRLGVEFASMRDHLAGGFPRSSMMRLANPSAEEMELWRSRVRDYLKTFLLSLGGRSTVPLTLTLQRSPEFLVVTGNLHIFIKHFL